jgi:hypothetical protein
VSRSTWILFGTALGLAMPALGAERAAPGTLLKSSPPPSRGNASSLPPPPAAPPLPPVVSTPAIRLLGFTGNKDGPQLPTHVATAALRLWGAPVDAAPITTARLLLIGIGPQPVPMAVLHTAPIRLWGAP